MNTTVNRVLRRNVMAGTLNLAEDDPMPTITDPCDVIVRVHYAGICGTDLHILSGSFPKTDDDLILGHEISGVVMATGGDATSVSVGSNVAINPILVCKEKCLFCVNGKSERCSAGGVSTQYGIFSNGGFRDFWKVSEKQLVPLPEGLPVEVGALTEPLACVFRGWRRCGLIDISNPAADLQQTTQETRDDDCTDACGTIIGCDSDILLQGAGIIGLLWAVLLRHHNYKNVTITEINAARRENAERLVPEYTIIHGDCLNDDRYKQPEGSFDLVIDCTGSIQAMENGLGLLRKGGKINIFGCSGADEIMSFRPMNFLLRDLSIVTTLLTPYSVPAAVPVVMELYEAGYLDFDKLGIKVYGIEDTDSALTQLQKGLQSKSILRLV